MTTLLRNWQRRCIDAALEHFTATPHFFCQATPGAGKTRMAADSTLTRTPIPRTSGQ